MGCKSPANHGQTNNNENTLINRSTAIFSRAITVCKSNPSFMSVSYTNMVVPLPPRHAGSMSTTGLQTDHSKPF